MSRPFESFDVLNRGWDVRFLENQSLRWAFVALLANVFMLGLLIGITIYQLVRLHRFDWMAAVVCAPLLLSLFRYIPLIYRRLNG
jgi:hypothetical protein